MDWAGRAARVRASFQRWQVDALLVTHLPNIRYLTGFTGSAGVLLVSETGLVFLTDFRYEEQAGREIGNRARVEVVEQDLWGRVWDEICGDSALKAVGYEATATTVASAKRFDDAAGTASFIPTFDVVEGLRTVKDPDEVEAIRRAARVATAALEAVLSSGMLRPGTREIDVAANLERELRLLGSEWHPFRTIVASGPNSALPHAGTSLREIARGDFVLFDFGAIVEGYCSDITRTVVVGRATEKQRLVYETVREAQSAACELAMGNLLGREIDHIARSLIERDGYGQQFGHSLGHGLGLEVHEAPRLSRTNDEPVPTNSVVTIEPGVYLPGWGGVRIEDDVYLLDGGTELLSHFNRELMEI